MEEEEEEEEEEAEYIIRMSESPADSLYRQYL